MKCPNCGCFEIDYNQARGDAACEECGTVLEQNLIVNEVGFSEDARGRSNVIGQHVRADGRLNSFNILPGFSREATELTMQNGRRRIGHIASGLRLTSRHTDSALQLFRLAVERNFHKGRRMANVCCACLYTVCRLHKTPHMLLDFADVLETNVYVLGHTFLKFAQVLSIQLPIIDPSLYIHRFASKLEFGDKTHVVAMSALRVMARMQRDWMSAGRRPSGLCGAALVAAAAMHNFYRSVSDVARVVRIGNVVLRERLQELDKTSTATMTAAQIDAGGGDDGKEGSLAVANGGEACDPPAFQRLQAKKTAISQEKSKLSESDSADKADNIQDGSTDADRAATGSPKSTEQGDAGKDTQVGATEQSDMTKRTSESVQITPSKTGRTAADAQLEADLTTALASSELQELERESAVREELDVAASANLLKERASCKDLEHGEELEENGTQNGKELEPEDKEQKDDDGELSDLDDEDTTKYLNTEEEYERKKELWTEINKEYLEKQERLEKMKRERPEEYKRLRPWRASQKKRKADALANAARGNELAGGTDEPESPPPPPPPKASKKLNYSVLKTLERSGGLGLSGGTDPPRVSSQLPPLPPPAPTV